MTPAQAKAPAPSVFLWRAAFQALRPHQWTKNVLVFMPAMLAHRVTDTATVVSGAMACVCFSLSASALYVINDLADLAQDRQHPRKRLRPFASGDLSARAGLAMAGVLAAASWGVALLLPAAAMLLLGVYWLGTLAYSLYLKRLLFLDVVMLAGFYTVRLLFGGAAMQIAISVWTLAFSMFLFLSLALVKRSAELRLSGARGVTELRGRGYNTADAAQIASLGSSSGYLSVLVFILYVNSPEVLLVYSRPVFLWLVCPVLLYWIGRLWVLTSRGAMHDDPIVFALKDRASIAAGVTAAACMALAA